MSTGRNIRRFNRAVDSFRDQVIRRVKRIIAETAEIIYGQAVALAPVEDGNLKNSIEVNYYDGGLKAKITVGASYAIYVEFGTGIYAEEGNGRKTPWVYFNEKLGRYVFTRGMHAQPFFFPAVEAGGRFFEREMNR
ncbi:HK97 gp10 family phage protein [Bacillus sonorensis]|uniref:HK97-gp10 family putative phage morphogenesis protein n=1 Tax=Bacillus sonorensis TaxID=119858 RepID=UPI002281F6A9|nr:HK97-gp10 family putative phage morphogenesis protein [Bacillus sonorensis]MCY8035638.1 HK97 gp10 family phage protein [Bacillus sonorensis]MCY8563699.1 HK97 gp10 family phage protein [Bacillus sonorensis]MEC1428868.1 HK97 gp10 family phage protein [Bacillus sonorensis]